MTQRQDDAARLLRQQLSPAQPEPEPMAWYDRAIELDRRHREFDAEREAQRQAEEEAARAPKSTAGILGAAISGSPSPPALNSAAIIRAALAGGPGTAEGLSR